LLIRTFYFISASEKFRVKKSFGKRRLPFLRAQFLMVEIFKHKERILQKSKATEDEVYEILYRTLHKITFINEETISLENFIEAYKLCGNIDEKDTPFIALTLEIEGELWTNDVVLKRGLIKKGFDYFFCRIIEL
jgi:predicted nucleic acid-binding protein